MKETPNYDYSIYDYDMKNEEFAGICHEFEYSILFFMVATVVGFSFFIYAIVLVTKRRNFMLYGFDILFSLVFLCAAVR